MILIFSLMSRLTLTVISIDEDFSIAKWIAHTAHRAPANNVIINRFIKHQHSQNKPLKLEET